MVAPFMINADNPLYSVNGVLNGILVKGDVIGDVMFYGAGAGKYPTASAVVADIVDEAKHLHTNIMTIWSSKKLSLESMNTLKNKFFVRIDGSVDSKMSEVTKAFGDVHVVTLDGVTDEFAIITNVMTEADFEAAVANVNGIKQRIRVEA
jgi:homoserine dehydrogenase